MATTAFQSTTNTSKYYMNPQAGPSPPEAYLYGQTGNTSPPMAQTPPSSSGPTSRNSFGLAKPLRQPRQPLYIPAALRPTDPPTRPTNIPNRPRAPDTPPASQESSLDSAKSNTATPISNVGFPPNNPNEEPYTEQLYRGLSRAASEDLTQTLGDVTGPPTIGHWKPDEFASDCAVCHEQFTFFFRRHHCRHCGEVICDNHSRRSVPLDQAARYHPKGQLSKACDPCAEEWKVIKKLRHSRTSSLANSQASSQGTTVPAVPIPQTPQIAQDARVGSMARSEGGGYFWSTF